MMIASSLFNDVDAFVAIIDERGVFERVNPFGCRTMGLDVGQGDGRAATEVFEDHNWLNERLGYVGKALRTGGPVFTSGIFDGCWYISVYRALPSREDGVGRVLCHCRPGTESEPEELRAQGIDVIDCKFHDLGPLKTLTPRELDVLRLIGEGLSTAEIATHLHRSAKTVEWHRVSLGSKLGVSNRVELARISIRAGLTKLSPRELRP